MNLKILKVLKLIIIWAFSLIGIIILTFSFFALIGAIQTRLFVPKDYILWIFKYPLSILIFIYEIYFIFVFLYFISKGFRKFILDFKNSIINKYKKHLVSSFIIINIVLFYAIVFNVTVITINKITDYSFLSPQGIQYSFNDIVNIETGVSGKKIKFPYSHYTKGDFYYIIQLSDDTKIHLTDVGGTNNNEDPRFIIEKLDSQFVKMDVHKESSMDNFEYSTEHLAEIYTDKIRNILLNVK